MLVQTLKKAVVDVGDVYQKPKIFLCFNDWKCKFPMNSRVSLLAGRWWGVWSSVIKCRKR